MKIYAVIAALSVAIAGCTAPSDEASTSDRAIDASDRMTRGDSFLSDFYVYDDTLDGPGKLLRQEALTEAQSNPGAAQNIRLLYSSTDGVEGNELTAVSGALFLPDGTAPEGGWPLMAWTHGTVGIADVCSPSWNGRQQQDRDHLEFWLKQGFAVVASDYQGLGTPGTHPYLATRPEAYSNLDAIRAVQSSGFPISKKVILFGQSQGAGAAVASAAFSKEYAPDLDIAGVVATGVPYFSPKALIALQESRPTDQVDPMLGYNLLALTLVERTDPDFSIGDYVADDVLPIANMVQDTCYKDIRARVAEEKLTHDRTFKQSPSERLIQAFSMMGFPNLQLPAPIFVGTGMLDKDTPPRMQAAFVRDACKAGSTIRWQKYETLDHRAVVPGSTRESLPFVRAAFAGEPIAGNCPTG